VLFLLFLLLFFLVLVDFNREPVSLVGLLAITTKRQTILFPSYVTINLFLAVKACYRPLKLGQVVVHTTNIAPLTLNSKAYRGA
jgi:hypothetical protein